MLKKYGDQRFIGASIGSATGGVPQNDSAFASLSIATQSAEYTTCAKTSPLKNPLPQVASRSANGLLAGISPSDLPAVFSFCARNAPHNQHVRILGQIGFVAQRAMPRNDLSVVVDQGENFIGGENHSVVFSAGAGGDDRGEAVKKRIAPVNHV